jgi:anti-anti-sigma factor
MEFRLQRDDTFHPEEERVRVEVEAGDPVVVRVEGKVFYDTLEPLRTALEEACSGPCPRMVIDLSGAPMCDSSGLNMFVHVRSRLTAAGGWLRLAGPRPMVRNVLQVTNLTRILPCYDTVQEAAAA